uniref:FH2 domain-containing protein n=1 Tax=Heliothis virescens TaxID=7102 RepID=A0A2A4K3T8_HELVI
MSFRNYYDTPSYGRSRDTGRTSSSTAADRPTTVTAKYLNTTPSYKSSSIPILCPERSAKEDTPISTIANRYANYGKTEKPTTKYDAYSATKAEKSPNKYDSYNSSKSDKSANKYDTYNTSKTDKPSSKYDAYNTSKTEKPVSKYDAYTTKTEKPISKYEKKDYSKLTVPSITTNKSRDVSPVSTSKYSLSRPSRHLSPERRATKTFKDKSRDPSPGDHDKDIPSKTDKSTGYNSLSSYKLYPRTSNYTRPASRADTKPEITVNRYAIANRLSSNYLRSPPTVKRTSVSPVNHNDTVKCEVDKFIPQPATVEEIKSQNEPVSENNEVLNTNDSQREENENETETVSIVTRHTSPTPPGSSAYVRSRRADMAKTIEKSITRPKKRPEMIDKEIQSDRLDDPTRSSRFGSTARTSVTNWSYYTPNSSSYTGYAGRYSTQYSNLRDNSGSNSYSPTERTGRSQSTEPERRDNSNCNSLSESNNIDCNVSNHLGENEQEVVSVYAEQNKGDDTSEIIINVNLKLKRAKSPVASTELVSPEITITNSQLPPQAPKPEGGTKTKKIKVKKSSADSSSDSSGKKKIIKRRSKSVSSTDSDQGSEVSDKGSPPKSLQKNSSSSNLQNGTPKLKHSKSRESASPESSITLSTQSSISEDETVSKSKTNEVSRTSADELSIPTDRSGKQPSPLPPQKNETGTEEAKSFLIRALAPVTNLFKMRHQESSDNSRWLETSTSESTGKDVSNITTESERLSKGKNDTTNIIASNDDNLVKLKAIRPIESGERAWWLESDSKNSTQNSEHTRSPSEKNIPRKIRHVESGEKAWWQESNSESKHDNQITRNNTTDSSDSNRLPKKCKFPDDEKPWWLDSCANIPEGIERLSPPRKSSSDSEKSEKFNFFKVRHNESGDQKDWWLTSNENSTNSSKLEHSQMLSKSGSERNFPLRRIRHIESGERPWWLASDKNIPEGVEKLPTPPPPEESDSSDSEVQAYVPPANIPPFPLHLPDDEPLGARRSPEGLETPRENEDYRGRTSPYENSNHQFRRPSANSYQKGVNKYISRYTDIDDILGTSGQIYSPFMDSILARRTGQMPYDDNDTCEEIDPTQVRIHDSTAQRPVIKKIRSRSNIIDYREEDQLDDATLQVFKDGDYGPYLDLDSTLGEQDEELEGLQDSRKNALVLRTQLSVRVHAIIERLLHSQGRELRRALFTLKQILQSDKDLVHEFVANKGLDCLMQVGNMADHNYLDYILRALGQILLYVDGMHGVMAHKRCIQWLYTLIASKFRHVVKTALKLLLVFVEYTEKNCLLLIDAIISVDNSNGRQPWYNIMKILQDFDASDTELLIYATTLINRCLNNVPDRDTYYDQVDALQDQGIDDIIQLYMSKQGTDLDLLRQLQIFEAVLLYEDGDETGTALKQLDDSVINSIRRRSINLSTERRKSKKQQCKEKGNQRYTSGLKQRIQNGTLGHTVNAVDAITVMRQKQTDTTPEVKDDRGFLLNREHSIKDLAQRLTSPVSPTTEEKPLRVSDMAGIVSKAKEELAKSQSKEIIKSPTIEKSPKVHEIKVSENDLHWEELRKGCLHREFHLCDLDFSDLREDSDDEMSSPAINAASGPPPPPPTMFPPMGIPPPLPGCFPMLSKNNVPTPPKPALSSEMSNDSDSSTIKKNKKTVKLFWKEIQENPTPVAIRPKVGGFIWDDLPNVTVDTNMLEHLFESRTNDLIIKEKLMEPKRNLILDAKRSNAINIAMKKLPTPQTIKAAIMKMDATVIGREGIEKLLTMLPTEEEKVKIQEAQYANPDLPLGSAEQFLLTLASINELSSRLKLWVFKLDFDNLEKEIAEPLMDLKQGIELLKVNRTFKVILSTLRTVGNYLNGNYAKGFRLEYLSKVVEVKDTVHKHPLLYHICEMIIEKFPDSSDFFSEVGPVIRASKVDFDVLSANLQKLESDCKASWDHMKRVAKHDGSQIFKTKINEFLTDAAERIILLSVIKKRVMSRFNKFLLFLGVPPCDMHKTKPAEFLKVIAEFSLEYRTTRERVLQQLEKKANHRERNKTRGKMIIDVGNYSHKNGDHTADNALKELLKTDPDTDSLTDGRRKSQPNSRRILVNGDLSADDEILESLVRSATSKRKPVARERRRNRISDRKNLNRTLDGNQS